MMKKHLAEKLAMYERYFFHMPILIGFIKNLNTPESRDCLAKWDLVRGNK